MARVVVNPTECEPGALPMLCMACGRPAEIGRPKTFAWRPPETILLWLAALFACCPGACMVGVASLFFVPICLILPFAFTKRRRVWTPLCPDHASYWVVRAWLQVGGTLAVFTALFGTIAFHDNLPASALHWGNYAILALVIVAIGWLTAMAVLGQRSIRPCYINGGVELLGVHADFVNALNLRRAAGRPSDEPDGQLDTM